MFSSDMSIFRTLLLNVYQHVGIIVSGVLFFRPYQDETDVLTLSVWFSDYCVFPSISLHTPLIVTNPDHLQNDAIHAEQHRGAHRQGRTRACGMEDWCQRLRGKIDSMYDIVVSFLRGMACGRLSEALASKWCQHEELLSPQI